MKNKMYISNIRLKCLNTKYEINKKGKAFVFDSTAFQYIYINIYNIKTSIIIII